MSKLVATVELDVNFVKDEKNNSDIIAIYEVIAASLDDAIEIGEGLVDYKVIKIERMSDGKRR